MAGPADNPAGKPADPVRRLCSEIQLFDLCDLEHCSSKDGRFCTDQELLGRFEAISDDNDRPPASRSQRGGEDEWADEGDDDDGFDDGYDDAGDEEYDENDYDE